MIQMQTQAMIKENAQSMPDKKVECVTGSAKYSQEQLENVIKIVEIMRLKNVK
jgi:hypothetical protein